MIFTIQNPRRNKGKKDKLWREAVRLQMLDRVVGVKSIIYFILITIYIVIIIFIGCLTSCSGCCHWRHFFC